MSAETVHVTINKNEFDELVRCAVAYVNQSNRHREQEQWKTRTLREAAKLARQGDAKGAKRLVTLVDHCTTVFDYSKVHVALRKAVEPFRTVESVGGTKLEGVK